MSLFGISKKKENENLKSQLEQLQNQLTPEQQVVNDNYNKTTEFIETASAEQFKISQKLKQEKHAELYLVKKWHLPFFSMLFPHCNATINLVK